MDLKSFNQAVQQIADEKGVAKEKIYEAIEVALAAAYKRDYGKRGQIVHAKMDPETGKVTMKQIKIVMDETMVKSEEEIKAEEEERAKKIAETTQSRKEPPDTKTTKDKESASLENTKNSEKEETEGLLDKKVRFNPEKHLMIDEAREIKADVQAGEELEFPLESHEEYGRIAAQTAKQVIIQRIREVEREGIFEEYKNKEGEVVNGLVQRIEGRNIFIDIGRAVGVLPPEEQISYERYRVGERLKVLITLVEKSPKGSGVFLSRVHPRLLKKLFEIEVPEIAAGAVEIKAIAREPGSRSKIAVTSHEQGVDPVGSLVGQKGVRVSTVINELGGEKIDVIEWSEDPAEFIANSLSPAKVLEVEISENRKEARAIVPEEQLSLAIGKGGQNVRLAAKLTGWKIDVRSKTKTGQIAEPTTEEITAPQENQTYPQDGIPEKETAAIMEKAVKNTTEVENEKPISVEISDDQKPKKDPFEKFRIKKPTKKEKPKS